MTLCGHSSVRTSVRLSSLHLVIISRYIYIYIYIYAHFRLSTREYLNAFVRKPDGTGLSRKLTINWKKIRRRRKIGFQLLADLPNKKHDFEKFAAESNV